MRKLDKFSVPQVLDTVNQLVDKVEALSPRTASGTRMSFGPKGVIRSANPGGTKTKVPAVVPTANVWA